MALRLYAYVRQRRIRHLKEVLSLSHDNIRLEFHKFDSGAVIIDIWKDEIFKIEFEKYLVRSGSGRQPTLYKAYKTGNLGQVYANTLAAFRNKLLPGKDNEIYVFWSLAPIFTLRNLSAALYC